MSIAIKRYIKNPVILITSIAFIVFLIYKLFYICVVFSRSEDSTTYSGIVSGLQNSLGYCVYFFVFFLFISYEYFQRIHNIQISEVLNCTKSGMKRVHLSHFIVLFCLDLFITALFIIFNLISYNILSEKWLLDFPDYEKYLIINILINVFLLSICAIFAGMTLAALFKRSGAYAFMIVFVSSVLATSVDGIMSMLKIVFGKTIYRIFDIFNILPIGLNKSPTYQFVYSILPDRVYSILFLIFLSLLVFLFVYKKKKIDKERTAKIITSFSICAFMFTLFLQPISNVVLISDHPDSVETSDLMLNVGEEKIENAEFQILKYKMNLEIDRILSAVVTVMIDEYDLPEYKFTLWNNFKVNSITDQNGKEIEYVQNGNYIIIKNSLHSLNSITFSYEGYSNRFFSNKQATFLAGYFPYYPEPGFVPIINPVDEVSFNNNTLDYDVIFDINVSGIKKAYSNINRTGELTFSGVGKSATVMAGFLEEKTVNGVRIIYPYLSHEFFYINNNELFNKVYKKEFETSENNQIVCLNIEESINNGLKNSIISPGETVIVAPAVGQQFYERNMDCDDCIIMRSFNQLWCVDDMVITSNDGISDNKLFWRD